MANGITTEEQVNVTTPVGFFSNTIEPVFNEDVFSEDNLSEEVQKPDFTSPLVLRDNIMMAAGDEDLSLTEFDASANLARQNLLSDLSSQDIYTRSKRDLQFNIGAERDIQFQQGRQLLSDIDAFIDSQRATVVQREYEKELERQEELLKEEKKEQLQLMAMQMGIDPDGMSRKELRSVIAGGQAELVSRSKSGGSSRSGGGRSGGGGASGGSKGTGKDGCGEGMSKNLITGTCHFDDVLIEAQRYGMTYDVLPEKGKLTGSKEEYVKSRLFGAGVYKPTQVQLGLDVLSKTLPDTTKSGSSPMVECAMSLGEWVNGECVYN